MGATFDPVSFRECFMRCTGSLREPVHRELVALDVVMREDDSGSHAAENLATLRQMVMNPLNRDRTGKRGIKGRQLHASWNHAGLLCLSDFWMRRP